MTRFVFISLILFVTIASVSAELTAGEQSIAENSFTIYGSPINTVIRAKRQYGCGYCGCGCVCATPDPNATPAPCNCGCCGCGYGR